jgi:hypothetical protein
VHSVEVTRRTESWQGEFDVSGLVLGANDALLQPDPLPARKLMVIGDSVACGEYADFRPGDPAKDNRECSARLSYGMIVARRVNAQCHLVSYGGRGVTRDWQGIRRTNVAPIFYELALPDDPKILWNPGDYVPDAILVCVGLNDFDVGIPDQVDFENAYVQFLEKIRRDAPVAKIFLIVSPILGDRADRVSPREVLASYLMDISARMGDPRMPVVATTYRPGRPGNTHPTALQQRAIADEIEPTIRSAMGWQ